MGLCGLPETVYVRQKDIIRCLGISRWDLDKVMAAGLIHQVKWPGRKRSGLFVRREIVRVFTKGVPHNVLEK